MNDIAAAKATPRPPRPTPRPEAPPSGTARGHAEKRPRQASPDRPAASAAREAAGAAGAAGGGGESRRGDGNRGDRVPKEKPAGAQKRDGEAALQC